MTWLPRTEPTLSEQERAAYISGDTATADLLARVDDAENPADLASAIYDAVKRLEDDIGEECLSAITKYVETYLTDDPLQHDLLALIERVQLKVYEAAAAAIDRLECARMDAGL